MSLIAPDLDNLRFQKDLVDEARRRIIRYCPDWTDYNVSDPGITLIELFAWMTEMIVYRLNQVPDKNHLKFMELLGMQLKPASSARVPLTFRLSVPFPIDPGNDTFTTVPVGTEVATRPEKGEAEVIFTTEKSLVIAPPKIKWLYRNREFDTNWLEKGKFQALNDNRPQEGDAFYLGFDATQDISGYILQLEFQCEDVATGIDKDNPPLVWECSSGNLDEWLEVRPSLDDGEEDTTEGLNSPDGKLVLYLPLRMRPTEIQGREAYWIRCRYKRRSEEGGSYEKSPLIKRTTAQVLGASTWANHAVIVRNEVLGRSSGEPNQVYVLRHRPVLELQAGEYIEVQQDGFPKYAPWFPVKDFSNSGHEARHFVIDTDKGEVRFGPAIRQPNGQIKQYGRIPETDRLIRFKQYRYGGGVKGNMPANTIHVLRSTIPYVDQVTNREYADGGRDAESLEEARMRAARELRAQNRAVTLEDYESLARRVENIARAKCIVPQNIRGRLSPGAVELLVVPQVTVSLGDGDLSKLHLDPNLSRKIKNVLDDKRLLTTELLVREPRYIGIKVKVTVVWEDDGYPESLKKRIEMRLRNFINPLRISSDSKDWDEVMGKKWRGWPFGRNLYKGELFSLIQRSGGIKYVPDIQIEMRPVTPEKERYAEEEVLQIAAMDLTLIDNDFLQVPDDALLCSLEHEIVLIDEAQYIETIITKQKQ